MNAPILNARLQRGENSTPWGFRMQGGRDFSTPISIQRVTPGSLASRCGIQSGDIILKIGHIATDQLRHADAQDVIVRQGNNLELTLQRGGSVDSYASRPTSYAAAPKAYSPPSTHHVPAPFAYSPPPSASYQPRSPNALANQFRGMNLNSPQPSIPPVRIETQVPAPRAYRPAAPAGGSKPFGEPPRGDRNFSYKPKGSAVFTSPRAGGALPVCMNCKAIIRGPFVAALGKTWCPNHFMCSNPNCAVLLQDCGFVEEEGRLYCERDFEMYFAPVCNRCRKPITRECVNALNHQYHTECFTCCHCSKPLANGLFHMDEGKPYCPNDWSTLFAQQCFGCELRIDPADDWLEALGKPWHRECFTCTVCNCPLDGQGFVAKNNRPYCKKHGTR